MTYHLTYQFALLHDSENKSMKWKKLDSEFDIDVSSNLHLIDYTSIRFIVPSGYLNCDESTRVVAFNDRNSHVALISGKTSYGRPFFARLKSSYRYIKFQLFKKDDNKIELYLSFDSNTFDKVAVPYDTFQLKRDPFSRIPCIKDFFHHMSVDLMDDYVHYNMQTDTNKKYSVHDLYSYVKNVHDSEDILALLKIRESDLSKYLKTELRDYQKNAVTWMIQRETVTEYVTGNCNDVHPLWQEIVTGDGKCYFNTYTGMLTGVKFTSPALPKGGILAEEMGLGKTVEVLTCIALNQRPQNFKKLVLENFNTLQKVENVCNVNESNPSTTCQEDGEEMVNYSSNNHPICRKRSYEDACNMEVSEGSKYVKIEEEITNILLNNSENELHVKVVNDKLTSTNYQNTSNSENNSNESSVKSFKITTDGPLAEPLQDILLEHSYSKIKSNQADTPENTEENTKLLSNSFDSDKENSTPRDNFEVVSTSIENTNKKRQNAIKKHKNLFVHKCGMCANEKDIIDEFIKCCNCSLVLHKKCFGYENVQVEEYECPKCAISKLEESCTTLIIVPNPLLNQWIEEIQKHVNEGAFKIKVYEGVRKSGFIHPKALAKYDIIIAAFDTIRSEFNYTHAHTNSKTLRHKKKYIALTCPLLGVFFWRVCIDEAQMVHNDNSKLAEMTSRLKAHIRWCVSGTPLQKGIFDIYGLLVFLNVYPYAIKIWWERALKDHMTYGDCKPLFDLASRIMWRTKKADVLDQIEIPPQTEYITKLKFSPIESHFYLKVQQQALQRMQDKLINLNGEGITIDDLHKKEFDSVLHPLLYLRQACCHPAVVKETHLSLGKTCVTMIQVIEKLISQEKADAIEAHRKKICSLNGIAGLQMLLENYIAAMKTYQQAIASWEQQGEIVKTDSLQKLHTYHNLLEAQDLINDKTLTKESDQETYNKNMNDIRKKYLETMESIVKKSEQQLAVAKDDTDELDNALADGHDNWWMSVTKDVVLCNASKEFLSKIRDCLDYSTGPIAAIRQSLRFVESFEFAMITYLARAKDTRANILDQLQKLSALSFEDIALVSRCCLRPDNTDKQNKKSCVFCTMTTSLSEYEKMLFGGEGCRDNDGVASGFRSNTDMDFILKTLHKCCKLYNLPQQIQQHGAIHLKYTEAIKKEFPLIRSTTLAYYHRIQDLDELEMCTMRLQYSFDPKEDISQKHHLIKPGQEELQRQKLISDQTLAEIDLKKSLSRLTYLENIAKVQSSDEGWNFETCPICVSELGAKWSVFHCGHCFCCECFTQLRKNSFIRNNQSQLQVRCPICRTLTSVRDVSFVVTKNVKKEEISFDDHITVKGDYSTKVEAVLRRVKWIIDQDETNKILIFSSWNDVLRLISTSLFENDIRFENVTNNRRKLPDILEDFKSGLDFNVLLLSHSTGSKGLNITEATHVILVEPSLNPSDELQAIGRVHRIGQKKETFVHRFIIESTVEEKMYEFFKSKYKSDKDSDVKFELKLDDLPQLMA